jgi:hypothetical protein
MIISPRFLWPLALAAFCARAGAAVLPAEKLLPKDTLMVYSTPDWTKASLFFADQPTAKLWQDPGLKPFKDKFMEKFTTTVTKPLEQSLGIKFADYEGLAQGQVTLAIVPVTPKDKSDDFVAVVLLVDTKDHAGQLKTDLAQIVKKWAGASKSMKSQKIRETEFTTFIISPDDLSLKKLFPGDKPADPADAGAAANTNKFEVTFGQSDSLLLVSTSTEAIDKILSRQSGGMVPPLEESTVFQADYGPRLRDSPFYLWLNAKVLTDLVTKAVAAAGNDAASGGGPSFSAILAATGLGNINSLSVSYKHYPEGDCSQIFLAVPEDKRPALLKIFAAETKDSGPPPFVPADAVKFWRYRLNLTRSYKTLETMLNDLLPGQAMAQINMLFAMAGKDKDEHYDLKAELLNNFGDDIISYSKAPKSPSLEDLKSAPTLYLLGSPNPDKLAAAIKVVLGQFGGAPITDREFLGRKIYNFAPPFAASAKSSGVSFSTSAGYLAIAGDAGILEEYLRSSDSKGKSLMEMPGLADAAQKVGGMGTGLFSFQNNVQTMRPLFEILRKQNPSIQDLLGVPIPDPDISEKLEAIHQWFDFSLLPPYETVAKYFSYTIFAGSATPEGFVLKAFQPTPPQLR